MVSIWARRKAPSGGGRKLAHMLEFPPGVATIFGTIQSRWFGSHIENALSVGTVDRADCNCCNLSGEDSRSLIRFHSHAGTTNGLPTGAVILATPQPSAKCATVDTFRVCWINCQTCWLHSNQRRLDMPNCMLLANNQE